MRPFVVGLCVLLCALNKCQGADLQETRAYLDAIRGSRQSLVNGVVRARETKTRKAKDFTESSTEDAEITIAFDYATERFRFDQFNLNKRKAPALIPGSGGEKLGGTPKTDGSFIDVAPFFQQRIDFLQKTILRADSNIITEFPDGKDVARELMPIDVRALGFLNAAESLKRQDLDYVFGVLEPKFESGDLTIDKMDDSTILLVKSRVKSFEMESRFYILDDMDYVVAKIEQRHRFSPNSEWSETDTTVNDWGRIEETVVLLRSKSEIHSNADNYLCYQIDLNWESVNTGVDDKWFDYSDFGVPENGVVAVSLNDGSYIINKTIGDKASLAPGAWANHSKSPSFLSKWAWVLIVLNAVVVILAIGLFLRRRNFR